MKLQVDGSPAPTPDGLSSEIEAVKEAASELLGVPVSCFGRVNVLANRVLGAIGVFHDHETISAHGAGDSVDECLRDALTGLRDTLSRLEPASPALTPRPQLVETLLHTWCFPVDSPPSSVREYEAIRDERFVYHFSDEEAETRARRTGEPFFVYGAKGTWEIRGMIKAWGRWSPLGEDIERIGWRLAYGQDVELCLSGPESCDSRFLLRAEDAFQSPTIADAAKQLIQRGLYAARAHIADLGRDLLVVQDGQGRVHAIGQTKDSTVVHPDTGPYGVPIWARDSHKDIEQSRRERLVAVLCCPACKTPLEIATSGPGNCSSCESPFFSTGATVDFLTRGEPARVDDAEASRNYNSLQLVHDLRLCVDGLALNAGAGDTPFTAENLVNLEIVRYENTDVVADGQQLPFRDDSFNFVFSQSVAEHVPDPFAYTAELQRVLKPGGTILVDVPFLAPFHGYPNHYFNPTMNGLRRLMSQVEEMDLCAGPHHIPSVTVYSIMTAFIRLMRDETCREQLLALPVGEFLDQIRTGQNPAVTHDVDPERSFEISAGFAFYGRKPIE